MTLLDRLTTEMKEAMKARDQVLLDTLRSAISAIKYKKAETGKDLSADEEIAVIQKQVKQRSDAIAEFGKAGRSELVEKETREKQILEQYLPAQKSEAEIRQLVRQKLAELPAGGRNQGALMKVLMPLLKGIADGNLVRKIVTEELEKNPDS